MLVNRIGCDMMLNLYDNAKHQDRRIFSTVS